MFLSMPFAACSDAHSPPGAAATQTVERVDGHQYAFDAARNAYLAMIEHLIHDRGYTRQQAYAICSVAVDLKVSQLVDVPNFLVSAFLPEDIFTD